MHAADLIPLVFVGGVVLILTVRLVSSFIKAKSV